MLISMEGANLKERVEHTANRFADLVSKNKLFAAFLILTILVSGSTVVLAPAQKSDPAMPVIAVPGKGSFSLASYPSLDRQVIGLVNLFRDYYTVTDLSNTSVNDLSSLPPFFTHYFLAFTTYGIAMIADSTPGFRTDYYKQIFHKLIAMMNSSTMERLEWTSHNFINESYAGVGNSFRGPTNIMWTGHYALMELFYESTFRDGFYGSEAAGYLDQWNASLTSPTVWNGSQSEGLGRWGVGLIPCEPYVVFVQCNSIPFYAMRLYDNLYGTTYQEASVAGIQWWQDNMVNSRGIPIDGYYVIEPMKRHRPETDINQTYPGPALTEGYLEPKVSAYGSAWATMFYNAMGMTELAGEMYKDWKSAFVHYSTDDTAYVAESYYYPSDFGINEYVANVFAYFCANEMGDSALKGKLENWFFGPFPANREDVLRQRLASLLEDGARLRVPLDEVDGHTGRLGSLASKQEHDGRTHEAIILAWGDSNRLSIANRFEESNKSAKLVRQNSSPCTAMIWEMTTSATSCIPRSSRRQRPRGARSPPAGACFESQLHAGQWPRKPTMCSRTARGS